jgi:tRNA(Phe) wybutosine-synthesizing methylase Tyw3
MEVAVARHLFSLSLQCGLKYTTVLCDGDSKTIAILTELDPYDVPITKEDCINHVIVIYYIYVIR